MNRGRMQSNSDWVIIHSKYEPYPLKIGSHQRIWQLAAFLRLHYKVCLVVHQPKMNFHAELGKVFNKVLCLSSDLPKWISTRLIRRVWVEVNKRIGKGLFGDILECYQSNPLVSFDPGQARFFYKLYREIKPIAVIAEYIWSAVPALPIASRQGICTIIDTHDVMTQRIASQLAAGLTPQYQISEADEVQLLSTADAIVAIQPEEAEVLTAMVPGRRVIVAEHPVKPKVYVTTSVNSHVVIFVGSKAQHNIDGIVRFIEEQWLQVIEAVPHAQIRIIGSVCSALPAHLSVMRNVCMVGVVDDLPIEYANASVVINPIRFGSGLKIKSVEALAYGTALVSTPLGVQGLEAGAKAYCSVSFEHMATTVIELLLSTERRKQLGLLASAFARERFSPDRCFSELYRFIQECCARQKKLARSTEGI